MTLTDSVTVYWVYGIISAVGAATDYRDGKIYNWLTFPAMLLGFAWAALQGPATLLSAAEGWGVALLVFLPMFLGGIMGAGDAKLMMALGTVLGPRDTMLVIYYSLVVSGVGSIILVVMHGRLKIVATEIGKFLRSIFVPGLVLQWPQLSREIKAPFGLAISAGFLLQRYFL